MFSWLLIEVQDASPRTVGIAQSTLLLPGLLLLLPGGLMADRIDPRRLIPVLHLLCVLPIFGLAALLHRELLTIPLLIIYGLCLGSIQALVMPARDAILSRVAGENMMRAVAGVTTCQFGGQVLGNAIAGSAEQIGALTVLGAQAFVVACGALGVRGAPAAPAPATAEAAPAQSSALVGIGEGLRSVLQTRNLRIPVGLVSMVGILFVGPFLVAFPILVADAYGGGSARMAAAMMTFPLGTVAGSLAIRARGGIRRKGPALLLALLFGALVMGLLSFGLPFPLFLAGAVLWGLGGAVFINTSRTLVQDAAPPEQRGRVLAVYQLGFVGSAPLGATLAGFVTQLSTPNTTLFSFACAMLAITAATALFSSATQME